MKLRAALGLVVLLVAQCCWSQAVPASGQQPASTTAHKRGGETYERIPILGDFLADQKAIVTAPLRLRLKDVVWLAPLAGVTAGLINQDAIVSRHLNASTSRIDNSNKLSNYGVAALAAAGGGLYLMGKMRGNDHSRDAGWTTAEAMASTAADVEVLKFAFGRQRPLEGDRTGSFRAGGQSFPSEHAALAWSAATVLAHEYPGPLTKLAAYGGAAAISVARVTGKDHFPSDVLIGSALGYFVGNRVWQSHHEREDDARYGEFVSDGEHERPAASMGSPYVPADSWVYGAFDRLAAMGYLRSALFGQRPWTRMECARLLSESQEMLSGAEDEAPEAARLQDALAAEFTAETAKLDGGANFEAALDSVYTRVTNISGTPINDGYHFAQTIVDDYGRPYRAGLNSYTGFTSHANAGPLAFYVSGEYQHAPGDLTPIERSAGPLPEDRVGGTLPPNSPIAATDRLRLLDAYVAVNARGWQASFGRQSLEWGMGADGGMLWSTNAEPVLMLRLSRTTPFEMPGVFKWLGKARVDGLFGRLEGHHFVFTPEQGIVGNWQHALDNQPFVYAQKISFAMTENLEIGVTEGAIVGGPQFPLTLGGLWRSIRNTGQLGHTRTTEPGDRRTGFDFRYRVPGARKWLTLYTDSFSEDQPNPIAYPRRSPMNPGVYMPQVPGIAKLDFRAEAAYSHTPSLDGPGYYYWNLRYLDGYTNDGNIIGNWVGRDGRSLDLRARYWVAAQNTIEFRYRNQNVDHAFLKGGDLNDFQARTEWRLPHDLGLSAWVQYENWNFPLITQTTKSNFTTSVQLTWWPKRRVRGQ